MEFLELTPLEYALQEWRRCTPFVEHVKSSRANPSLDNLNPEEEATIRFGFWCYQAGWLRERAEKERGDG